MRAERGRRGRRGRRDHMMCCFFVETRSSKGHALWVDRAGGEIAARPLMPASRGNRGMYHVTFPRLGRVVMVVVPPGPRTAIGVVYSQYQCWGRLHGTGQPPR